MKTRKLGNDGPEVSAIGLGCMRMTPMAGQRDERGVEEGVATIRAALDQGVTLINTGDFYAMGANEMLVGQALRGRRDEAFLCVKFGAMRAPAGQFLGFDTHPRAVKNFCSYSLQRLGVEVIDLYQPSRVDPQVPIEDTIGAIKELIEEGKVRHLGVSEFNAEQLRRAHAVHPVTALEIEYSLASRFIEAEILPTARALGVGVVPYSVVTQGLLTGTVPRELPAGDTRRMFPRFQGENLDKNVDAVASLSAMAQAKGATPAQIAIAWVLSRGEDLVPLVGMSTRSRLPENLGALDVELTSEELATLGEVFAPGAIVGERYPDAHIRHVAS